MDEEGRGEVRNTGEGERKDEKEEKKEKGEGREVIPQKVKERKATGN